MTANQIGRYSKFIRPIAVFTDVLIIAVNCFFWFNQFGLDNVYYFGYLLAGWFVLAFILGFYKVYRFTTPIEIISKIVKQGFLFLLLVVAYFPFLDNFMFDVEVVLQFCLSVFILITLSKFFLFYCLKQYRIITGNNFRSAIIIGYTAEAIRLKELFESRREYGYVFSGFFSNKVVNQNIKGNINSVKTFVVEKKIDEIYCSLNEVSNEQLKDLIDFADENFKTIKFIPDTKEVFTKSLKVDYYDFFPVLSLPKTVLDEPVIKFFKRTFDIVFSLVVIFGILSWLTPILAILIKLESKGTVFFKQGRPGINENEFNCYKFRSMRLNDSTETETFKNDPRVTVIGRFMRKTSMDELPQFLNVLIGDMSVVGPRPHLWSQNITYSNKIKKYMKRHFVKPGITGLAQVSGYRGEILQDTDMINRVKLDVFYIENWSLILDLKIIYQTLVNIYKGDTKAY
ncbi:exopolysaccharide biosynthesis polyprenyl glycosylphosphotransferase [Flavobacterium sp.]|uniref:exopolysaccharide biosynthesis polyprenyl glycosylphosphotransferase n=1 Tax=Flavobacterium sp. TaxID=239 RepID=UPI002630182E|nr:exopolysaccharide biosynthesis polyprenyl glycosylphosphotransferase [Flavobacterium sp.]MDG2433120.1 exopolysaccharide biosynthesis polyprenyl glycosylphosphotransferase [Flavobacterium sp.]